ncbi:MAG: threonine synthase [Deltaproteobacteria bacterium]|nr:threonine synthase [Deltaproteobacteria bacterium]
MLYPGLIRQYRTYLPVAEEAVVTLHEGRTPLFESKGLVKKFNLPIQLYLKLEGLNPTGSFKDRGMTYAVSKAVEMGTKAIICASTGNTSASAAAYAARAGIAAMVVVPEGKIALGKLSQAQIHGAQVFQVKGNFDEALAVVKKISEQDGIILVNSINPHRLLGQQTAAFEIVEDLGDAPDYHFIPVGNAGNIVAYYRGYTRYFEEGKAKQKPKMCGFQAAGSAPIVLNKIIEHPETVASAIRIGNPANWQPAKEVAKESGGFIDKVEDEEILAAYEAVAQVDGFFCEPASAASIAGLIKKAKEGFFKGGEKVVCTLTGHGLKDPDQAIALSPKPHVVEARVEAVLEKLKW